MLSKTVKPAASAKRVEFDWITLHGLRNFNMKETSNKVRIPAEISLALLRRCGRGSGVAAEGEKVTEGGYFWNIRKTKR